MCQSNVTIELSRHCVEPCSTSYSRKQPCLTQVQRNLHYRLEHARAADREVIGLLRHADLKCMRPNLGKLAVGSYAAGWRCHDCMNMCVSWHACLRLPPILGGVAKRMQTHCLPQHELSSCNIEKASHVLQCLRHMPQIEFALGAAESTAEVQTLGKSWGMCSSVAMLLIPCKRAWSAAAESL